MASDDCTMRAAVILLVVLTPTTTSASTVTCPTSGIDYLPDGSNDCSGYVACSGGVATYKNCRPGKMFHTVRWNCVDPSEVTCPGTQTTPAPTTPAPTTPAPTTPAPTTPAPTTPAPTTPTPTTPAPTTTPTTPSQTPKPTKTTKPGPMNPAEVELNCANDVVACTNTFYMTRQEIMDWYAFRTCIVNIMPGCTKQDAMLWNVADQIRRAEQGTRVSDDAPRATPAVGVLLMVVAIVAAWRL